MPFVCLTLLPLLAWSDLPAARAAWHIDSSQSHADFAIRLLLVKKIDGRFSRVEGGVRIEHDRATIDVRVDASAIRMRRPAYTRWAQSAEFFDTARHPWIQFRAGRISLEQLQRGGSIEGLLTLRGVTRPMRLLLSPALCSTEQSDCRITASGEVDRTEFGMTTRRFVLANTVTLTFEVRVLGDTDFSSGSRKK